MVIVYNFEGEEFAYGLDITYKLVKKIIKDYNDKDLINLINNIIDDNEVKDYLEGQDIKELNRDNLVELIEELIDFDNFGEYFVEELRDMFENKAYKEYKDSVNYWE